MRRVDVGVRKAEMWEEANLSTRLRYLILVSMRYIVSTLGEHTSGY